MPPQALALVVHAFLSFVICSVDRINLAVAIIPMSRQLGWDDSVQGLIQSIFFLGYMSTAIAGGRLADTVGGRTVLAAGVAVWSLCTAAIPPVATRLPLLLAVRVLLGAGEGVAMPAMNSMIAAAVPEHFRARSLAFIYSGMYVGSILGLLVTPPILAKWHYPGAFYVFAIVGLLWVAVFLLSTSDPPPIPAHLNQADMPALSKPTPPPTSPDARSVSANSQDACLQGGDPDEPNCAVAIPLSDSSARLLPTDNTRNTRNTRNMHHAREQPTVPPTMYEIFAQRAMWAIIIAHFCCTWGYFVLLAWLPTFLNSRFALDVSSSSWLASLPWLAMFIFANVGGVLADALLASGLSVTTVRKTLQAIGFAGPAFFLLLVMRVDDVRPAVAFLSLALAASAFSQSGVYANHQDIGPGIAGTLLGVSNMFASLPGLIGVFVTGVVLQITHRNWNAVFAIAVAFYLIGLVSYTAMGTSRRIW